MSDFELPQNLAREFDDGDQDLRGWVRALPATVDGLAERWDLRLGKPFQPGGVASWAAPARDPRGTSLVLKVGWIHDESLHEAEGLRMWAGRGAVRLTDAHTTETTAALLLEACEPGTPLARALPPEEQDAVVANLVRRLRVEPPAGHPFRSLRSMCERWADEFEEDLSDAEPPLSDPGLLREGVALFRDLPATATESVLLCTDLHQGNVLAAEREPWLMIDPKPYMGDPTYEPVQYMLNCPGRLVCDAPGFARRMAAELDLDEQRLRRWLFARWVTELIERPYLIPAVHALAP